MLFTGTFASLATASSLHRLVLATICRSQGLQPPRSALPMPAHLPSKNHHHERTRDCKKVALRDLLHSPLMMPPLPSPGKEGSGKGSGADLGPPSIPVLNITVPSRCWHPFVCSLSGQHRIILCECSLSGQHRTAIAVAISWNVTFIVAVIVKDISPSDIHCDNLQAGGDRHPLCSTQSLARTPTVSCDTRKYRSQPRGAFQ